MSDSQPNGKGPRDPKLEAAQGIPAAKAQAAFPYQQGPKQSGDSLDALDIQSAFDAWDQGLDVDQQALQSDLSALADGELDEAAAARVMVQVETDPLSRAFFEDIQRFSRLHKDMAEPQRVIARLSALTGEGLGSPSGMAQQVQEIDLVHRLATIFYSLGKAYILNALNPESFRQRVFEEAVPIEATRTTGRGFVDGVLKGGRSKQHRVDWREARHYLNGRLERVEDPMSKGLHLLEQALATDPSHEEARIYLGFVYAQQGKRLKAESMYRDVFDTAIQEENRGHAAVQIGQLHMAEEEPRRAAVFFRWLCISGLESRDERFWFVRFNIAMTFLGMGKSERCLDYLVDLAAKHPTRIDEAGALAVEAPLFQNAIQTLHGFAERFAERCPEYLNSAESA